MALFCPNINSPEYKKLKEAVGSDNLAYYYWNKFEGNLPNDFYAESEQESKLVESTQQSDTQEVVIEQDVELTQDEKVATKVNSYVSESPLYNLTEQEKLDKKTQDKINFIKSKLNLPVLIDNTLDVTGKIVVRDDKKFILINPAKLSSTTVFHEFAHIFLDTLGLEDVNVQELWRKLNGTDFAKAIEYAYPELSEKDLKHEILAESLATDINQIFDAETHPQSNNWLRNKVNQLFNFIGLKIGKSTAEVSQLAKLIVSDAIKPDLNKIVEREQRSEAIKQGEKLVALAQAKEKLMQDVIDSLNKKADHWSRKEAAQTDANVANRIEAIKELANTLGKLKDIKGIVAYIKDANKTVNSILRRIDSKLAPDADYNALTIRLEEDYLSAYFIIEKVIGLVDNVEVYNEFESDEETTKAIKELNFNNIREMLNATQANINTAKRKLANAKIDLAVKQALPYFHKYQMIFEATEATKIKKKITYSTYVKDNPKATIEDYNKYIQGEVSKLVKENADAIEKGEEDLLRGLFITSPEDISLDKMWLSTGDKINDVVIQSAVRLLSKADYNVMRESIDEMHKAWDIYKEFDKVKPQDNTKEKYSEMLEDEVEEKDGVITVVKGEKSNHIVDTYYSLFYTKENELKWAQFKGTDEEKAAAKAVYKKWIADNTIDNTVNSAGFLKGKLTPANQWKNPQYATLLKMVGNDKKAPIWNMYNYIKNLQRKADAGLVPGAKLGMKLPSIESETTEKFFNEGIKGLVRGLNPFHINAEEAPEYGTEQDLERAKAEALLKSAFKNTIPVKTNEAGEEKKFIQVYYRYPLKNPKNQSFDLLTLALMNFNMSNNFKQKAAIAADIEILKDIAKDRNVTKTDLFGRVKTDKDIKDREEPVKPTPGVESNAYKILNSIIDDRLYGIKMLGNPYVNKAIAKLTNLTSKLALVGNIHTIIRNLTQGAVVTKMESIAGGRLESGSIEKGIKRYKNNGIDIVQDVFTIRPESLTNLLLDRFDGLHNWSNHIHRFSNDNAIKNLFSMETLYKPNNVPEHLLQGILMYGLLETIKVKDNKGNIISLADAYEVEKEVTEERNGKLVKVPVALKIKVKDGYTKLDGGKIDKNFEFDVAQKLASIAQDLYGSRSKMSKPMIERYSAGVMVMSLHRWIYQPLMRHVEGISTIRRKAGEQVEDEGLTTSTLKFGILLKEAVKQYKKITWALTKDVYASMTPTQQANILKQLFEVAMITVTGILSLLMRQLVDDDEDDKLWKYYVAYHVTSLNSELSFYYNPIEWYRLAKSPAVPLTTVAKIIRLGFQLLSGNWTEEYESGRRAGELKLKKYATDVFGVGFRQYDRDIKELVDFMFKTVY